MKSTWTLTRTRRHYAPYLVATALFIENLTPEHWSNLSAVASIAVLASLIWMVYTQFRDPVETLADPDFRALATDVSNPAHHIAASTLRQFANPEIREVHIRITRGVHDDGPRLNVRLTAHSETEGAWR